MRRMLVVTGGVLAGFAAVVVLGQTTGRDREQPTWWSQVREFAAQREVELRDALGLNDAGPDGEVA